MSAELVLSSPLSVSFDKRYMLQKKKKKKKIKRVHTKVRGENIEISHESKTYSDLTVSKTELQTKFL